jgi:hypothetical protein
VTSAGLDQRALDLATGFPHAEELQQLIQKHRGEICSSTLNHSASNNLESVTLICAKGEKPASVTKLSPILAQKRTKTEQIQKIEIIAILRLAKGFS